MPTMSARWNAAPASCILRPTTPTASASTRSRTQPGIAGRFRRRSPTPPRRTGAARGAASASHPIRARPTLAHGKICHIEMPAADAPASATRRGHRRALPGAAVTRIQPELWVDRAAAAVAFYRAAFGATVLHRVGAGDDIVAHLAIGDAAFWVAAASPGLQRLSPKEIGGATCRVLLIVEDPDQVLERAVGAGA